LPRLCGETNAIVPATKTAHAIMKEKSPPDGRHLRALDLAEQIIDFIVSLLRLNLSLIQLPQHGSAARGVSSHGQFLSPLAATI
jgi:hypothetical protein